MGDCVGRGQQIVTVKARKQVLWNVFIPKFGHLQFQVALLFPFGGQRPVNDINDLDEKRGDTRRGVEDLHEWFIGGDRGRLFTFVGYSGKFKSRATFEDFRPRHRGCEAVFEPEFVLEELVDATDKLPTRLVVACRKPRAVF